MDCLGCGKKVEKEIRHVERAKNGNFCTHACWSSWNNSERVYNWAGGHHDTRPHREKGPWRKRVRARDGNLCQICGSVERIEVHHILPYATHPDVRWDDANGVTLCKACHTGIRGKELEYVEEFRSIVKKNEANFDGA